MEYEVRAENLPSDPFVRAYLEAAEWAGISECVPECGQSTFSCQRSPDCEDHEAASQREALELSVSPKWDADSLARVAAECEDFQTANAADLANIDPAQAGHDFYLTRNGHGTGFWDRGLGEVGERLTRAAKVYGDTFETFDAGSETLVSQ